MRGLEQVRCVSRCRLVSGWGLSRSGLYYFYLWSLYFLSLPVASGWGLSRSGVSRAALFASSGLRFQMPSAFLSGHPGRRPGPGVIITMYNNTQFV